MQLHVCTAHRGWNGISHRLGLLGCGSLEFKHLKESSATTFEELNTLLTDVEATLNSHPMVAAWALPDRKAAEVLPISTDPDFTSQDICMEAMENLVAEVPQCPHSLEGSETKLTSQLYCSHKGCDTAQHNLAPSEGHPCQVVEVFTNVITQSTGLLDSIQVSSSLSPGAFFCIILYPIFFIKDLIFTLKIFQKYRSF